MEVEGLRKILSQYSNDTLVLMQMKLSNGETRIGTPSTYRVTQKGKILVLVNDNKPKTTTVKN